MRPVAKKPEPAPVPEQTPAPEVRTAIRYTPHEAREQYDLVAELRAQYANERQVLAGLRRRFGQHLTKKRAKVLIERVEADWARVTPAEREARRERQIRTVEDTVSRLSSMALEAAQGVRSPDGKWEREPRPAMANAYLRTRLMHLEHLAKLTGTLHAQEVAVTVTHQLAPTVAAVLASLTQEQADKMLAAQLETERKAKAYELVAHLPDGTSVERPAAE